ncbi:MAG: MerR family transcriptional regulator [Caldilineales bacterium]|nr:MerR family transcriptional regulator [Caldilineales bacterium]
MTESGFAPSIVARQLGISSSTLRRWTRQFSAFLSDDSHAAGHSRYNDADLETLTEIKRLLAEGMSYQQAEQALQGEEEREKVNEDERKASEGEVVAMNDEELASLVGEIVASDGGAITAQGDGGDVIDLGRLMAETLGSLSESQKMVVSGQQTMRQLMGVLLQDNFNLKEENSRLRERMLEAERKLFELKRDMNEVQTTERERMRQMEASLFELQRRMDVLGGQKVSRQGASSPAQVVTRTATTQAQPQPKPQPQPQNQPAPTPAPPASPPVPNPADTSQSPSAPEPPLKQSWWRKWFGK